MILQSKIDQLRSTLWYRMDPRCWHYYQTHAQEHGEGHRTERTRAYR